MCSHFENHRDQTNLSTLFDLTPVSTTDNVDVWPGYDAHFITQADGTNFLYTGSFGLIPNWAKNQKIQSKTYNARTETVAQKPSFKLAWQQRQHCIIPAQAIYEPKYEGARALPTRIYDRYGAPLLIAGLWNTWRDAEGQAVNSFTMLTIGAAEHSLMKQFHHPDDEKRMVVMLDVEQAHKWLKGERFSDYPVMPASNLGHDIEDNSAQLALF